MEKKIAILMADLSGYTALTETHGPLTAADLIDRYIQIAENCMVDDCSIHERRGDEIMVVSDSPGSLLATALKLKANTVAEENFLQVHGGLHFGNVLQRADSYFGSAINLASRIAASGSIITYKVFNLFTCPVIELPVSAGKEVGACHRVQNYWAFTIRPE